MEIPPERIPSCFRAGHGVVEPVKRRTDLLEIRPFDLASDEARALMAELNAELSAI